MLDNSPLMSILEFMQELPQVFTVSSFDSDCPWVKCKGWIVSLTHAFSGEQVGMCLTIVKKYWVLHPLGELSPNLLDATTQEAKG